jgi:hypothetical protein
MLILMDIGFPMDCNVPQGSFLGPFKFIAFTEEMEGVIASHGLQHQLSADDMQLHGSCARQIMYPLSVTVVTLMFLRDVRRGCCS